MTRLPLMLLGLAGLIAVPFIGVPPYWLHIMIIILIWSFAYTGWSVMGRFGLVSLGHGAFMGIGAYGTALLWNHAGLTPWVGIPVSMLLAGGFALLIGYPCFKYKIVGHYFALVTLALSVIVGQVIVATRKHTGGSLGYTPEPHGGEGFSIYAFQFPEKTHFYLIALAVWVVGLIIWRMVDKSMSRYALEAISEDEDASAAVGVQVTREKLKITMLSAVMTAFAGAMYCQYQLFVSPDTVAGVGISLQIVFAVVAGGIYTQFGPTVGAIITIILAEVLRINIGELEGLLGFRPFGLDNTIYGIMLVLFIIFLPRGVLGSIQARMKGGAKA
jgi:branched-chain amino acid transport system permease protein